MDPSEPATGFLEEKILERLEGIGDNRERSREALRFYIEDVFTQFVGDPAGRSHDITDGPGDGGLDGYFVDPEGRRLHLFQCKWYSSGGKLSLDESLELFRFYTIHLKPGSTEGLNEQVSAFVRRFRQFYKDFEVVLHYISTVPLDNNATKEYVRAGVKFDLVSPRIMAREYAAILSEEEKVSNRASIEIVGNKYLSFDAEFPAGKDHPAQRVRVLQCAIRASDLKRIYTNEEESLFSRNLRFGLGGKINRELKDTAKSDERAAFYVLHNGVSIVSSKWEILRVGSKPEAEFETDDLTRVPPAQQDEVNHSVEKGGRVFCLLKDMQIVNGAQTTITLSGLPTEALEEVILPCKITQTDDVNIASQIAVRNNTQNSITPWDLVANSPELTLLQNYASRADPRVFVQRRRGESWSQLRFIPGSKPPEERSLVAKGIYQAFLSFSGQPGPAYSRLGSVLEPNEPVYVQIAQTRNLDAVLAAGLIERFERLFEPPEGTGSAPEFTKFWTQWAIALVGHIYRNRLTPKEQANLLGRLIGADGQDFWSSFRDRLVPLMSAFLERFPTPLDPQRVFKNNQDDWAAADMRDVNPKQIWHYISSSARAETFEAMREKQKELDLSIEFYDVNFAVLAVFTDRYVTEHPLPGGLSGG